MKQKLLALTAIALAGGVQAAGATTPCVRSTGAGGCYTTIQTAVDAASSGQTIHIHPHASPKGYTENVTIATANLTLAGVGTPPRGQCPKAIVDTCETIAFPTSCGGAGFDISAAGVTIRNLTIRHATDAILIQAGGTNTTVDRICSLENDDGVEASAAPVNNVRVLASQFLGDHSNHAIDIDGDDTEVKSNVLHNADGIKISGARAQVVLNTVRVTTDEECIEVDGDDALIHKNTLEACDNAGIDYFGDNGELSHNRIRLIPDDDEGISARGDNVAIRYNWIADISENGIQVFNFTNGTIAYNTVERAGNDEDEGAIEISGDNNLIEHNTTRNNSFAGILNDLGNANTYRYNLSTGNGKSGFRIEDGDGNVLDQNRASNNLGEGINNDNTATNTVATGNVAQGNRTDVCNDGTFLTFTGNTFTTGGTATPCVVEQ